MLLINTMPELRQLYLFLKGRKTMSLSHKKSRIGFVLVCLLLSFVSAYAGRDDKNWKPVDPADLKNNTPVVEKDADAEAIFWEVYLADEIDRGYDTEPRTVLRHYIRIKIFNERGRESQGKVKLFFGKVGRINIRITDIEARTIRPDGTIVELKKDDILETNEVRADGLKVKAKSFVLPNVEPGAIVEYRWKERRGDSLSFYDRLEFSREDIPVRFVKYYVKPLQLPGFEYGMRLMSFNGKFAPFTKEKDGYYSTSMSNVPAFTEEPRMPPQYSVRPWTLIYYAEDKNFTPEKFWPQYSKDLYDMRKDRIKPNDDVKKKAAELTAGATTPEEKLARLYEFCRTQIKYIYEDATDLTMPTEQAKKINNKTPGDTLKKGMGDSYDIKWLFAALAGAAGFDARIAQMGDKSDMYFYNQLTDNYFISDGEAVAIKLGEKWQFFDPSDRYMPMGMLPWEQEGMDTVIADSKGGVFSRTPISDPNKSVEKRTAKLRLLEDGTLEGEVTIEATGHIAAGGKEYNDDYSPAQREKSLIEEIKKDMSTAEITDVKIENITDSVKPLLISFKVRVPGYAQKTKSRIFFQPGFFEYGSKPLFQASARKNHIAFNYAWSELDELTIELPKGYVLDNADAPAPVTAQGICADEVLMAITKDNKILTYKRKFFFGGGGNIQFMVDNYQALKNVFDIVHKTDTHSLTLKQVEGATSN